MNYQELKAEENKYVMNTYGRYPIALDHGEGATVWDVEGKNTSTSAQASASTAWATITGPSLTQSPTRRTS